MLELLYDGIPLLAEVTDGERKIVLCEPQTYMNASGESLQALTAYYRIDPETGLLRPFDFRQITSEVPELKKFGYTIDTVSFDPLIDSSDINPDCWVRMAQMVYDHYDQ